MNKSSIQCCHCDNSEAIFRCSGCKKFIYCSEYCQKQHWFESHKYNCNNIGGSSRADHFASFCVHKNDRNIFQIDMVANNSFEFEQISGIKPALTRIIHHPKNENMYLLFQTGQIMVKIEGQQNFKNLEMYLDISERIKGLKMKNPKIPFADERGLLGAAFHPIKNNLIYLLYSTPHNSKMTMSNTEVIYDKDENKDNIDHIGILSVVNLNDTKGGKYMKRPTKIGAFREEIILAWGEPQFNHNGGSIIIDNKGETMYIGLGDGGGREDRHGELIDENDPTSFLGYAQDFSSIHGKILRFKISKDGLSIGPHEDNILYKNKEFTQKLKVNMDIFAFGFRNPWDIDFYRDENNIVHSNKLVISDVGQQGKESLYNAEITSAYF